MSYTVDYKGCNDMVRTACKHAAEYIGFKNYRLIVSLIKADEKKSTAFAFMMVGVQGYPCRAMWERYNPGALPDNGD